MASVCRHFLELDGSSAEHLAAHQGRKTVGGIAIHALGSSLAHHLGQDAREPAEAPASVHGAPVSAKVPYLVITPYPESHLNFF